MEKVILIGTDSNTAELHRLMARAGVEVEVRPQMNSVITGTSAAVIMADELLNQVELLVLRGSGTPHHEPFGLAAAFMREVAARERAPGAIHGNPRPYLKRKKGRW